LAQALLSVPALQPGLLGLLLDKLPEHFDGDGALDGAPLQEDVGRLIIKQFRWLDLLVDADAFLAKLVEVLSVAPPRLKKEIIGSIPEIVGDKSHPAVVSALESLLQEDSQIVVAVLDTLSDLNLNAHLQEQVILSQRFSSVLFCVCWLTNCICAVGIYEGGDSCNILHPDNSGGPDATFAQVLAAGCHTSQCWEDYIADPRATEVCWCGGSTGCSEQEAEREVISN
jgi:hypothetical protein